MEKVISFCKLLCLFLKLASWKRHYPAPSDFYHHGLKQLSSFSFLGKTCSGNEMTDLATYERRAKSQEDSSQISRFLTDMQMIVPSSIANSFRWFPGYMNLFLESLIRGNHDSWWMELCNLQTVGYGFPQRSVFQNAVTLGNAGKETGIFRRKKKKEKKW